ncbi:carboxypeptidase regulatory-like domain-containing protein [Stieleria varia]|uniref:BlaR1 peptidase M56 n=1 Tax=Stieleria varia TaxID=2528005 RepID=A0A5C6ANY3_9BACT|nr:carboxypeptidase regulatory-like domain-containing protein [Stieleria varia]TWU00979.1 BlaR1 peptidase M56 [Stieleria varia]
MIMQNFSQWLAHSTIFGTILLAIGAIAVLLFRQPVHRVRIIHWTLVACLLVPLFQQFHFLPSYSLGLLQSTVQSNSLMQVDMTSATESVSLVDEGVGAANPGPIAIARTVQSQELSAEPVADRESNASVTQPEGSTHAQAARRNVIASLWLAVQMLYLMTVAGMGVFWCLAISRRSAITRRSRPAKKSTAALLSGIAGTNKLPKLLVSDDICSPVMWGLMRSTIVIPSTLENGEPDRLRWGLAHEWAHVVNRDYPTWILAAIAKFVCFFQPHYWWLRRQLTLSQDYLADAYATDHGESAEDYAAFLVELARDTIPARGTLALGIADSKSNLFRRVQTLVVSSVPLLRRPSPFSVLAIALTGVVAVASLSLLRLGNQPALAAMPVTEGDKDDGAAGKTLDGDTKDDGRLPDPITYVGKVIDRETGKPIKGASVEVIHELSRDPNTNQWVTLRTTTHVSDENGRYEFTLPPEEVAQPSLYIVVDAHHPNYQPKGQSGYAHSMIRTNLEKGEPPFFETIKLSPGEPIMGQVLNPDGAPAVNTRLLVYSKSPTKPEGQSWEYGAFQNTATDDEGRFRMVVATPGDGVLWIYPKNAAPRAIRLRDKRGQYDSIQLNDGKRLTGQVLDTKGEPVANVGVSVDSLSDGEDADEFLNPNAVSTGIRATAMTDAQGKFELLPLPPGEYSVRVEDQVHDPTEEQTGRKPKKDLDHAFSRMKITISDDDINEPLVIRALPHVIIRGRFFDAHGKPRASHSQHLFGKVDGEFFSMESSRPGEDGWFEFKAPHGATDVRINTMTNEHSALRWRLKPKDPLSVEREINLGTLEEDITTLEIVRYKAPILLVKIIDETGKPIDGFKPDTQYVESKDDETMMSGRFVNGGVINFEKQPDGRWRSGQMQPDTKLQVTILENDLGNRDDTEENDPDKEAQEFHYVTKPQTVSLAESDTKEIVFVMEKQAGSKDPVR